MGNYKNNQNTLFDKEAKTTLRFSRIYRIYLSIDTTFIKIGPVISEIRVFKHAPLY